MSREKSVEVFINKHDSQGRVVGRKKVKAFILEVRSRSFLVRLPEGKIIVRRRGKDVIEQEGKIYA